MPLFSKKNGSHKEMTDGKVKVGGEWKQGVEMLVKVNGKWKQVWENIALFYETIPTDDGVTQIFPFKSSKPTKVILRGITLRAYDKKSGNLYRENVVGDITLGSSVSVNIRADAGNMLIYYYITLETNGISILMRNPFYEDLVEKASITIKEIEYIY